MAKQIKTIKCPQCGSALKTEIKPDHFRCNSCGTEYFLDNDDLNINIRQQYRPEPASMPEIRHTNPLKVLLIFGACAFFVTGIVLFAVLGIFGRNSSYHTFPVGQAKNDRYLLSTLLSGEDNPVAFTVERNRHSDSVSAVFTDITTGGILKKHPLPHVKDETPVVDSRYFHSDSTLWLIWGGEKIFTIDCGQYTLTDRTAEICARKPALEAGILSAAFVDESLGEGFELYTGLGKTLYFFPVPDALYTEQAARYAATAKPLPSAKEMTYYLFSNKETSYSSNVAELMRIVYLFNGGGPEDKMTEFDRNGNVDTGNHRILSCDAITEERICFSPEVLFYDEECILISYRPTVARDAGMNIELLDTKGNIHWTVPFTNALEIRHAIRTAAGFVLQVSDEGFCMVSADGKSVQAYTLTKD